MKGKCILCHKSTRRKPNPMRPCCLKCERTAPVAVSCPGAFLDRPGPANGIAKLAIAAAS